MVSKLSLEEFRQIKNNSNTEVLDIRHQSEFIVGHISCSIFVGIDGLFEPWVELFIEKQAPILLISPEGREAEAYDKLTKIGFKNIKGYLEGSFKTWQQANLPTEDITSISVLKLEELLKEDALEIFDIRKQNEYDAGHLPNVNFKPLAELTNTLQDFALKNNTTYIHCGGGYRSVIACSILKQNGIHSVVDIAGGFGAIRKTNLAIES